MLDEFEEMEPGEIPLTPKRNMKGTVTNKNIKNKNNNNNNMSKDNHNNNNNDNDETTQSMMHGSLNNIFSPMKRANATTTTTKTMSLQNPPFVSPGVGSHRRPVTKSSLSLSPSLSPSPSNVPSFQKKFYPTSSFLDKPSGTPMRSSKPKVNNNIPTLSTLSPFSPKNVNNNNNNNNLKNKNGKKSWKDQISFQASSPSPSFSPGALSTNNKKKIQVGGLHSSSSSSSSSSFLGKNSSLNRNPIYNNNNNTPDDIQIEVKIPDIEAKIKARKRAAAAAARNDHNNHNNNSSLQDQNANIPEWMVKQRQRQANVKRKQQEKEDQAASLITAYFLGHSARVKYPQLLELHKDRLEAIQEQERMKQLRIQSSMKIQKTWRMYLPRKRFLYVQECRRRREKNKKEMKRIEKVISKMPKTTKAEIKEMKKEYAEKKKELKKKMKGRLKEDEKKIKTIQKSGKDTIEYMKGEKVKLQNQCITMQKEYALLEKQLNVLTQKSDEIAHNFLSLQGFVQKTKGKIQKNEINSQKCRHRYLPKIRAQLKDSDQHCVVERRVSELYKTRLDSIVQMLDRQCKSKDRHLVFSAQEEIVNLQKELKEIPKLPIPEGLADRL